MSGEGGFLRRALSRISATDEQVEADELQTTCQAVGATPVASLPSRDRVAVCGTLRTVTLRPRAGVPALEAELYDGSGTVSLVWLGRRRIPGIEPGRSLTARGFVTRSDDESVIFNPAYELRAGVE